jgi:fatty-acyl-CoA synthase
MLYTAASNFGIALERADDTVFLSFFPQFWIAGENLGLVFPVFCGATLVLLTRWDPVAVMTAVQRYRVTCMAMPVDGAVEMMDHPRFGEFDLRSLRQVRVVSFVKKLNLDYRRRWQALTGGILAEAAWGMTETHTSDTFTTGFQDGDYDLHAQPVFVGLPVPGTEFKICDFDTGALKPLGVEGEIRVRSPSLLKGYWNKPEATAEALVDGWLRTGDIGVIDEQGFLHFLGRRKEMLKVKGMSVFPPEIEAVLGQHPAVLGSGVIGRLDEVVIDCRDADRLARFWQSVLGGRIERQSDEWVAITGLPTTVSFQVVPEPKVGKNRVHLDIAVDDLAVATAAAVASGATVQGEVVTDELGGFQVMLDPEANEFCLIHGPTAVA